ncbi:hypothetical protein [Variovorax fucosicus]|nr:hypothetical protein [Variovorax sp. J22R193]
MRIYLSSDAEPAVTGITSQLGATAAQVGEFLAGRREKHFHRKIKHASQ